jgi:hypothetical protein
MSFSRRSVLVEGIVVSSSVLARPQERCSDASLSLVYRILSGGIGVGAKEKPSLVM